MRAEGLVAAWRSLSPAQLFVGSFLMIIGLGTVGFMTLPGLYAGPPLGWVDALFTATSAVCVTGLIVVDTATYFTTWGQAYILLLIQLGGLGILSFTSLLLVVLGERLSLRHEALAGGEVGASGGVDARRLTGTVVRFTVGAEMVGAVLLWLSWGPQLGWREAVWPAVFHAVSAFCNAGFSTFSTSLAGFQGNVPVLLVVLALVVLGGLGFLSVEELYVWRRERKREGRFRLSVHTRLVLGATAILIVGGWGAFTAFEWSHTLAGLSGGERLVNGLFASITPRTAGFNTIDYAQVEPETSVLTLIFMAIGGSPGSTAGGLKTTTVALLGLLAWARLTGRPTTSIAGRTIPEGTLQKAMGLVVVAVGVVIASVFLLSVLELPDAATAAAAPFLSYLFEAVSALNTVGLSMGPTGDLSMAGRLLTVVLMFIGRVGPLTVAAAMSQPRPRLGRFRYAYEDVPIG
jgi:trk system potassium uptake protein TrkH